MSLLLYLFIIQNVPAVYKQKRDILVNNPLTAPERPPRRGKARRPPREKGLMFVKNQSYRRTATPSF